MDFGQKSRQFTVAWSACFFDGKEGRFTIPAIRPFTGYRIHRLSSIGSMQIHTEASIIFVTFRMDSPLSDKNKKTYDIEEFPHSKSNEKQIRKAFQKALAPIYILCYYTHCIPHMEFKERI